MQEARNHNNDIAQLRTSISHGSSSSAIQNERDGSVRVHSGSGFRFVVPFPWRLHQILDDMEKRGDTSIISWQPDGRRFRVHNPSLFMSQIVPKIFKQKSFKSFQRQLHIYGFQRLSDFSNQGAYYHENFIRGNRQLCLQITRIKAPPRRRLSPKSIEQQTVLSLQNNKPLPSSDTTEWLIRAGVPFSTLDPHPVALMGGGNKNASIYDWAEEITSIFSQVSVSHQKSMTRKTHQHLQTASMHIASIQRSANPWEIASIFNANQSSICFSPVTDGKKNSSAFAFSFDSTQFQSMEGFD